MSNFVVSATPHVRSKDSIQGIMRDVIIALVPATVMGIVYFGLRALVLVAISIASAVFFEFLYQKLTKQRVTIDDLSAVVTGLLLALNMPASAPFWMPIVGSAFAIIIAKQLFGGLGQNFINPALAARAFLLASYPTAMTTWTLDGVTTATPLALLKSGDIVSPTMNDYMAALTGHIGGCIGETCAIALIIGGLYLLYRKVISWRIPVVYIVTVVILTGAIGRNGVRVPLYEVLVGGLLLGAFFMATDYASSPVTAKGQIIMGIGCGLLTSLIRIYGGYPEGVSYSILIMNLCVPLIDRFTKGRIFGARPKEAKKA
ncbi:Na+-transporting NADH:ubiquinone oxidoreductase subunit D [Tyzzerella sp. An114]|uniref:RnfABCDGE type electron transport complex subunit D n=1 Tax=Tyzzerella sp. An114 TaxID=1965545 RepID=UPI000B4319BF|nr:RnfABCDGE type electron transport complex subunit D [Tyzzerella sp. An114]OUQ59246.1 Na+-transporting NADH:ubiquinone oxidoreductase subunit D [Tyzzerella sp. An114]HIT72055.1 RnfABCDGE type electron transport complex subunit D [Candidatus Fimicola cottocaccae]